MEGEDPSNYTELRKYLLPNVRLTGTRIGAGAYATVEEVAIPGAICVAKRIHEFLQDPALVPADALSRASQQFVEECRLLASLDHPNIVEFYGIYYFPGARLPALVMERLQLSLHDLLNPPVPPSLFLPLRVKCSILYNVACGLAYLHNLPTPVIHRDLSARNVVLNAEMEAKLVDLGVTRIEPLMRAASTMTMGPGTLVYMPPEAIAPGVATRAKNKPSIDIFSFGVLTIFTISETFPEDPLPYNYFDVFTGSLVAYTELERRREYMQDVKEKLRAYGQFHNQHPLLQLIKKCLENVPGNRPNIREVLHLLEKARANSVELDEASEREWLTRAVREQTRNMVRKKLHAFVTNFISLHCRLQSVFSKTLQVRFSDNNNPNTR